MIKYQVRKEHENWMTVESSSNNSPNLISITLDKIERSYPNRQVRAINENNQIVDMR